MSLLQISGSRMILKDSTGAVRFDTDEGLFTVTNFLSTANGDDVVSVPQFRSTGTRFDVSSDIRLTRSGAPITVNSAATHVFGMLKGSSSATGLAGIWTQANGTIVRGSSACGLTTQATNDNVTFNSVVLGTFVLSGGGVFYRVRATGKAWTNGAGGTSTLTYPAETIDYRLYVGLFV